MKTSVLSIMSGVCKEKFLHAASESELSSLLRGVLSRGIGHNWSEISVGDKALLKENQFYWLLFCHLCCGISWHFLLSFRHFQVAQRNLPAYGTLTFREDFEHSRGDFHGTKTPALYHPRTAHRFTFALYFSRFDLSIYVCVNVFFFYKTNTIKSEAPGRNFFIYPLLDLYPLFALEFHSSIAHLGLHLVA